MARKKKKQKKHKKRSPQKQAAARDASAVAPQAPTAASEPAASKVEAEPKPTAAPPTPPPAEAAPPPPEPSVPSRAPASAAPPVGESEPVEDLDLDLDEGDADSYESLVALVAGPPDEAPEPAPSAPSSRRAAVDEPVEDVVEVLDLDDDEDAEALDRLIAKAVVNAPPVEEEVEPEVPLIDLDADVGSAGPRGPAPGQGASASSEAARLAAVVARGAIDDTDLPAISLDLGEVSTPEARARLLAEALAHAEHQEARYRVPIDTRRAGRWKGLAATAIFVLAAWVAVVPPAWVRPAPPAQLNAAARARSIRAALLLQAQQVEAFRIREQRLPDSLDELPVTLPGVRYARSGNRAYQLVGYELDGNAIVFDSTNPSAGFRVLMSAWPPAEDAP